MEDVEKSGVFFKDCAYYTFDKEGPFCPVCYAERDNKLVKMIKKNNVILSHHHYECPDEDCQIKIFPSI